jgi:SSS family solute:Na+ symporter
MAISIIAVIIFFIVMFSIGFFTRKFVASSTDFLLAGREMSVGVNSMGVLASGFAGTTIALAPAFVLMFGLLGVIFFILAVCVVGYLLYGLFFAKGIRRSGAYTMMEWLEMRFDYKTRRILTISGFVGIVAITANNCLAMANVLTGFFGLSIYATVAISVLTFLCFTYLSGMWGVSLTDFVQAIIGCVGVPVLIISAISQFGSPAKASTMWEQIAKADLFSHGINGATLPGFSPIYPSMLTILLSLGVFLVWGGQHYWIRMASARSEGDAKKAMIIGAVSCAAVTAAIGYIGVVAGANFGDKFTLLGGDVEPNAAYGFVSANFGVIAGSFLLVFSLAASLSTCASTLMGAVSIATKDIYPNM